MNFTITDEITDEQFAEYFAQPTRDDFTNAESIGVDEEFGYEANLFEQVVADIVNAVFRGGELDALVTAPGDVDFQLDLVADGDGLIEGFRFLLHPASHTLPILASSFQETRYLMDDRDLKGVAAAIDVARNAQHIYRQLIASFELLTAQDMQLWVLTIEHRHGQNTTLYRTEDAAKQAVAEYVDEWWNQEATRWGSEAKPDDNTEKVDRYFERVEDEFYSINSATVQS
jgi:hypothetical protein